MSYYPKTTQYIRQKISERYPYLSAREKGLGEGDYAGYILWMLEEIEDFPKDPDGCLKAARWIGWILAICEEKLSLFPNEVSRNLVRKDVKSGKDRA